MSLVRRLTSPHTQWALTEEQRSFGSLRSKRGALPLDELRLKVLLRGLDFSLRLTQTFVNVHRESIEAVYIFPLPARAAVSAFRMVTENGEILGRLKERGQARAHYQEAVSAGRQAAMVEEERPEIFTMTVGNIPAQQKVTIHLDLDGPLTCSDDHAFFRFPLVVAPRYIPGRALAGTDVGQGVSSDTDRVPDASRITPPSLLPGYPNPVTLAIDVELQSPLLNWPDLQSTLPLRVVNDHHLCYAPEAGKIDHDFLLVMPFHPFEMKSSLQVQKPERGVDGLLPFCLTLVPPASLSQQSAPKEVVILLDRSGSMGGWSITAARRTVARILESLNNRDSFSVLAFDDQVEEVRPSDEEKSPMFKLNERPMVPATDRNVFDYSAAVERVEVRGGTVIAKAVAEGLNRFSKFPGEGRRHLILVTDGLVGNEREVLALVKRAGKGVNVYSVAIGSAPNTGFLKSLSKANHGLCEQVSNEAEFRRTMTSICRRMGGPTLQGITVEEGQDLVYQHNDLYPGLATRVYGRLPERSPDRLKIKARRADGTDEVFELQLEPCQGTVERLWAREHLLQMEYDFSVASPKAPSAQTITDFSLKYGVLSRFTAFLAVDEDSRVPVQTRSQVQPVSTPAGMNLGTIKVDLLPTEKRSFGLDPVTVVLYLLTFPISIPWLLLRLLWQWLKDRVRQARKNS